MLLLLQTEESENVNDVREEVYSMAVKVQLNFLVFLCNKKLCQIHPVFRKFLQKKLNSTI